MSYYRPSPTRFVWGVVIACASALALFFAARATTNAIRADERAAVQRAGDALLQRALDRGAVLARERDSLRAEVAKVDTVVIERIRQAKAESAKPIPPATDTAALVAAVRSCRWQLDTLATACNLFRRTATTALAQADTIIRRDSAAIAGLSLQLAAIRRADSIAATTRTSHGRTRAFATGVCVASLAGNYLQWRAR